MTRRITTVLAAKPARRALRSGFTLVEVLVALLLVGLVLVPSSVVFHRLLEAGALLRRTLSAEVTARQMLEAAAFDASQGLPLPETAVTYPLGGVRFRLVSRYTPPEPPSPARIRVLSSWHDEPERELALVLPPTPHHASTSSPH